MKKKTRNHRNKLEKEEIHYLKGLKKSVDEISRHRRLLSAALIYVKHEIDKIDNNLPF